MKLFVVLAVLVATALAAPANSDADAVILKLDADNIGVDGYKYAVETSNNIKQEETGVIKNPGTDAEALEVRGQFSYVGVDGVTYTVTYVANELGFQPSGAHLPQV